MRQHDNIKGHSTEAALTFKLYTMAVFFDTEGGNYGTTLAIHQALSGLNVEQYTIDCLETMLAIRIFTGDLGNSCPSKTLGNTGPHYLTALIVRMFPDILIFNALYMYIQWLGYTKLVLFTIKTNIPSLRFPWLNNCEIPLFYMYLETEQNTEGYERILYLSQNVRPKIVKGCVQSLYVLF